LRYALITCMFCWSDRSPRQRLNLAGIEEVLRKDQQAAAEGKKQKKDKKCHVQ
jgi:hypothetical protein